MREELDVAKEGLVAKLTGSYAVHSGEFKAEHEFDKMICGIRDSISTCFSWGNPFLPICNWDGNKFESYYKNRIYSGKFEITKEVKHKDHEILGDISIMLFLPNENKANRRVINKLKKRVYSCLPYRFCTCF